MQPLHDFDIFKISHTGRLFWKLGVKKWLSLTQQKKGSQKLKNERKEGETKRTCSQKTWSDQTHAMLGKSAQPEKMIIRARTKNRTQLDSATNPKPNLYSATNSKPRTERREAQIFKRAEPVLKTRPIWTPFSPPIMWRIYWALTSQGVLTESFSGVVLRPHTSRVWCSFALFCQFLNFWWASFKILVAP